MPPGGPTPAVAAVYATYPASAREKFLEIRQIILAAAAQNPDVGPITETLKWGEPAYLTEASKSGSTIRLSWSPKRPNQIGMFLNCQTSLVETIRTIYPDTFTYEGSRAVLIPLDAPVPRDAVEHSAKLAQTYHRWK